MTKPDRRQSGRASNRNAREICNMANSKNTTDYYVYLHRYASGPKVGQVFYVGKGTGNRAFSKKNRNKYWKHIVAKHGYTVELYATGLQEWYAYELEFFTVAYYGRENLCNLTDGGEGPSSPSEETRKTMSEKAKARIRKPMGPMSEETKLKLSIAKTGKPSKLKGIPLTEDTKRKLSESKKGKPNGHNGMKRSDQAKENMSIAQKNSKNRHDISGDNNPAKRHDVRNKISESRKGNPKITGSNNPAARRVICIETGAEFGCIADAKKWLKSIGKTGTIKECLSGRSKTSGGLHWKYAGK